MPGTSCQELRKAARGLIAPLLTMTGPGRTLDERAQNALVDMVAPHVDVVFVASASTGFGPLLHTEEKMRLVELVAKRLAKQGVAKPVLAGVSGFSAEEAAAQARALRQAGAWAVAVCAPCFYPLEQEELVDFFVTVAVESGGAGVVVENAPHVTGNNLAPPAAAEVLRRVGGCFAWIECCGEREQFVELSGLMERTNLIQGSEALLLDTLTHGVSGCAPLGVNVLPLLFREFVDRRDDLDAVEALHKEIAALRRDVYGSPRMSQEISGAMTALQTMGIGHGPRRPFLPMVALVNGRSAAARIAPTLHHLRRHVPEEFRHRVPEWVPPEET
ncbi:MAG TPA: dihydrodipicolinate synthase family protein [Candidatus Brocadiia bacterium]|nr:dihydrodipicolinate synthase family protein [Candidatus Brocadiia bacterium]